MGTAGRGVACPHGVAGMTALTGTHGKTDRTALAGKTALAGRRHVQTPVPLKTA